jgi:hypothetical protein
MILRIINAGFIQNIKDVKTTSNQGITYTIKNGCYTFVIVTTCCGIIFSWLHSNWNNWLVMGLYFGLVVGLNHGLGSVIKHYSLRMTLCLSGKIPIKFIPFLDYCTKLILLKKVGGGYIFIHRMLLEYFANLDTSKIKSTKV